MPARPRTRRTIGLVLLVVLLAGLLGAGYLDILPPKLDDLVSHPNPAASYADAAQRVAAWQAQEGAGFNPLCRTILLTHGQKTARAIAFVHGYSNCPAQFAQLGQKFYDLGYNVLIAPVPHHGLADLLTTDLSNLTAEELAAYGDQVVDILHGLGDQRTLAGMSLGGTITGWAAQNRADLDQALVIAPGFGLKLVPGPLTTLAVNAETLAPDLYVWWDPRQSFNTSLPVPSPNDKQGYPRFSLHGLAQELRLSLATRALAQQNTPAVRSIIIVTNAADTAVDNGAAQSMAATWRDHGASVTTYEFPLTLLLPHDLIDPAEYGHRVDIVYPKLIELLNAATQ